MTRSGLQPIRSRRVSRSVHQPAHNDAGVKGAKLTPATRTTLAAIGALWVSFAVTASANPSTQTAATSNTTVSLSK